MRTIAALCKKGNKKMSFFSSSLRAFSEIVRPYLDLVFAIFIDLLTSFFCFRFGFFRCLNTGNFQFEKLRSEFAIETERICLENFLVFGTLVQKFDLAKSQTQQILI